MTDEYPPAADAARFHWITRHPYVAERERRLLGELALDGAGSLLEIGCGEGANLFLGRQPAEGRTFGLERSRDKLGFARRTMPWARWIAGDALALPFRDGRFDSVLLRDVLHHVSPRSTALAEAARVTRPGGRVLVLEANGRTLLAQAFSRLLAHERGLRESSFERVRDEVESVPGLAIEHARLLEPLPLFRLAFHHRYGVAALGHYPAVASLVERLEGLGRRLPAAGSYILIEARVRR